MSTLGGANLHRWGFLPIIAGGFVFMATGIAIAMWAGHHGIFWCFVAGLLCMGIGAGLTMSVASTAIIGAAPPHRSGMAAGVEEVSYELGTLLSIAITGSIVPLLYSRNLPADVEGMQALYDAATHDLAAAAYDNAYLTTLGGLLAMMLLFAAVTGYLFKNNPKSGGYDAAH